MKQQGSVYEFRKKLLIEAEELRVSSPKTFEKRMRRLGFWSTKIQWLVLILLFILMTFVPMFAVIFLNEYFGLAFGLALTLLFIIHARSMLIRYPLPPGLTVNPNDVPELYDLVNEVNAQAPDAKVHAIILNDSVNAQMTTHYKWGIPFLERHYLVLGMSMMSGINQEQLRAVIAHELGHMPRSRSRGERLIAKAFNYWTYLDEVNRFTFLKKYQQWCIPQLWAYLVVTGRQSEFASDELSWKLTSHATAGSALVNIDILNQYLEYKYWPELHDTVREHTNPPSNIISGMMNKIRAGEAHAYAADALTRTLARKTCYDDSHPSLIDRLAAIEWPEPNFDFQAENSIDRLIPEKVDSPALDHLVSPRIKEPLVAYFDKVWMESLAPQWIFRHAEIERSKQELAAADQLLNHIDSEEITSLQKIHAHWYRTLVHIDVHGIEASLDEIKNILTLEPNHPQANFTIGEHYLQEDNPEGIAYLESALQHGPLHTIPSCELLYAHFRANGNIDKADEYRNRAESHNEKMPIIMRRADVILFCTRLNDHNLFEIEYSRMQEDLRRCKYVKEAHLFKIDFKKYPHFEFYILGIILPFHATIGAASHQAQQITKIMDDIYRSVTFHYPFHIVPLNFIKGWKKIYRGQEKTMIYKPFKKF